MFSKSFTDLVLIIVNLILLYILMINISEIMNNRNHVLGHNNSIAREKKPAYIIPSWESAMRNEKGYIGKRVIVEGKVTQYIKHYKKEPGGDLYNLIMLGDEGNSDHSWVVVYRTDVYRENLINNDKVIIHGIGNGDYSYQTVLGASKTAPSIIAYDIRLKNDMQLTACAES